MKSRIGTLIYKYETSHIMVTNCNLLYTQMTNIKIICILKGDLEWLLNIYLKLIFFDNKIN